MNRSIDSILILYFFGRDTRKFNIDPLLLSSVDFFGRPLAFFGASVVSSSIFFGLPLPLNSMNFGLAGWEISSVELAFDFLPCRKKVEYKFNSEYVFF